MPKKPSEITSTQTFSISPDPWLTQALGKEVFGLKLPPSLLDSSEARQVWDQFLKDRGNKPFMCCAKVPIHKLQTVHALSDIGFRMIDVSLALSRRLPAQTSEPGATPWRIRPASEKDLNALQQIASEAFSFSRFHLDPRITNKEANQIKRLWVRNYVTRERGDVLMLAEGKSGVVGFLAILKEPRPEGTIRVVDLIGVLPSTQHQGVGQALMRWMLEDSASGYTAIRAGTQAANLLAVRFYENLGFRLESSAYVLHAHERLNGARS